AHNVQQAKWGVDLRLNVEEADKGIVIVDVRDEAEFKKSHLPNSINIMARGDADKFETWLGAIVEPEEAFYLAVQSVDKIEAIMDRVVKIGYENQIKGIITLSDDLPESSDELELSNFREHPSNYTILDIRNK